MGDRKELGDFLMQENKKTQTETEAYYTVNSNLKESRQERKLLSLCGVCGIYRTPVFSMSNHFVCGAQSS